MTQDLFVESALTFEKTASEVALPEDPNAWPNEILQELFKQVPYISDFEPHVVMDRVDAERGFAFGHIEVMNKTEAMRTLDPAAMEATGIKQARVPIIVRDRKLQPFDCLVTENSRVVPLTESRLRSAVFRPQAFDTTSLSPGDTSLVGQLYPPFRQGGGFGGGMQMGAGGVGKMASAGVGHDYTNLRTGKGPEHKDHSEHDIYAHPSRHAEKDKSDYTMVMSTHKPTGQSRTFAVHPDDMESHGWSGKSKKASKDPLSVPTEGSKDRTDGSKMETKGPTPNDKDSEAMGYESKSYKKVVGDRVYTGEVIKKAAEEHKKKRLAEGLGAVAGLATMPIHAAAHVASRGGAHLADRLGGKGTSKDVARGYHKTVDRFSKSSVKRASILADILPTIEADTFASLNDKLANADLQAALVANAEATAGPLGLLSKYEPADEVKTAAALYGHVPCDVVQLTKVAGGYSAKAANHSFWAPTEHAYNRGEAVRAFGEKIVLAADMNGTVTVAEGAEEEPEMPEAPAHEAITEFGAYTVHTEEGEELEGLVFPELIDIDGKTLPMMLFTNGEAACLQGDIVGTKADHVDIALPESHPRGYGFFTDGHKASIPLDIKATLDEGEGVALVGETFDGRSTHVMVQPNIMEIMGADGKMVVPSEMHWVSLDQENAVKLVGDATEAEATEDPKLAFARVVIRAADADSYSLSGMPLDKIASAQKEFISFDEATFLLATLGVAPDTATKKMASAFAHSKPIGVITRRAIKTAGAQISSQMQTSSVLRDLVHELRVDLLKEAAVIPDPVAVDTVLSLGFINPENLGTFIGYLPLIDEAQSRMCELLVASRLGMRDVPVSALEKAVRATEDVLEGLKVLAFQKN